MELFEGGDGSCLPIGSPRVLPSQNLEVGRVQGHLPRHYELKIRLYAHVFTSGE